MKLFTVPVCTVKKCATADWPLDDTEATLALIAAQKYQPPGHEAAQPVAHAFLVNCENNSSGVIMGMRSPDSPEVKTGKKVLIACCIALGIVGIFFPPLFLGVLGIIGLIWGPPFIFWLFRGGQ